MSKVIDFISGDDISPAAVNADLVEMFEELLERAKAGTISAAAVALVRSDDNLGTRWSGGNHTIPMAAAICRLHFDFMNGWSGHS
jgi:hypothetical protein